MISVLLSLSDKANPIFLKLAFQSICHQERRPHQVVVVCDGPIDESLSIIVDSFKEELNLFILRLGGNVGLGAALHAGLPHCSCNLVARMDADDIALPDRFAKQLAAFSADSTLDVLGGFAIEIDGEGRQGRLRSMPTSHDQIVERLWANPMIHPSVMFRRDRILSVGSYSPSLRRRQDYELWFRCAAAGLKFGNLPEPLIEYRFTPDTHRRQSRKDMWQQGKIGFHGSRKIGLPLWKQMACFVPFLRSLLPLPLQHGAYRALQRFDPRKSG